MITLKQGRKGFLSLPLPSLEALYPLVQELLTVSVLPQPLDWLFPALVPLDAPQASADVDQSSFPPEMGTILDFGAAEFEVVDHESQSSDGVLLLRDAGNLQVAPQLDWSTFVMAFTSFLGVLLLLDAQASAHASQSLVDFDTQGDASFSFEFVDWEFVFSHQSSVLRVPALALVCDAAAIRVDVVESHASEAAIRQDA